MKKQILKTVYTLLCCIFLFIPVIQSKEKPLELQINPYTGAISGLKIPGDKQNMEWLVKTDGSQYAWIKEDYGWGLGYFTVDRDRKSLKREWSAPTEISRDGMDVVYREADIRIQIKRRFSEKDLIEQYTFTNEGKEEAFLHDIGIYTPFNDNYPNAKQCINERTHAHIWEGENAAYVNALRILAKQYRLTKDKLLKTSLLNYAHFLREKLQTKDYVTYSSVDQTNRNRGYNYIWVADFYFQMYQATGNKLYAVHGYQTLQSMFRQFGYGFYAIGIPVQLGLQSLKKADMTKEYKKLLSDFVKTGDVFIKNGLNYPAHEVNYEQSIVAPAIQFLAQLYLVTKDNKYLDEVKRQMPVVEAFNGFQPSYHLNEVGIRHWDGHWFGKREMFGDTFPHYWSTITGAVYYYYALCTGDKSYMERAQNVVRNNLCLFFEDGRASCAYMYPYKINGIKAQFYDPYANDQDWALVYYLLVNHGI